MASQALFTSVSDRWFTPPDLLTEIRAFLGDYHDPCPASLPGMPIENGLWQAWRGVVFVNPPYGRAIAPWIRKAVTEPVDELLLLVPARTDTAWFQPLYDFPICFLRGRLHFSEGGPATFPSALVYRGPRVDEFAAHFAQRGPIMLRKG